MNNMDEAMNAFLIASPLQLLNAIEAKHFFKFKNNHLIIILGLGYAKEDEVYEQMIFREDWDKVHYVTICIDTFVLQSRFLGERLSKKIEIYWNAYKKHLNRRKLDKIAKTLSAVDNIILGNYLEYGELYFRHFANKLDHKNLYLVDDGTDVLQVNDERRNKVSADQLLQQSIDNLSLWKRMKRNVRKTFVEWNASEDDKVIFFTAYDIDVREGDQVVRNEYCHLRARVAHDVQSDDVLFLGQCLIEDKWIEKKVYFEHLRKVRSYFSGKELFYIPHPREFPETVSHVENVLGFKILRTDVPIECHLTLHGKRPKVLAAFFCSALVNCSIIYAQNLCIKSFYIDTRHILINAPLVRDIYHYFSGKANENFEIVRI